MILSNLLALEDLDSEQKRNPSATWKVGGRSRGEEGSEVRRGQG